MRSASMSKLTLPAVRTPSTSCEARSAIPIFNPLPCDRNLSRRRGWPGKNPQPAALRQRTHRRYADADCRHTPACAQPGHRRRTVPTRLWRRHRLGRSRRPRACRSRKRHAPQLASLLVTRCNGPGAGPRLGRGQTCWRLRKERPGLGGCQIAVNSDATTGTPGASVSSRHSVLERTQELNRASVGIPKMCASAPSFLSSGTACPQNSYASSMTHNCRIAVVQSQNAHGPGQVRRKL